ncbi:MAG: hypothetical protein E7208_00945 [Clostridium butyricum]|nr:hypothetical protein [Clostridium butyricum]
MGLKNNESPEYVFNTWLNEKCNENDLVVVNDMPFLIEDCISILRGNITEVQKSTDKLIVITEDNISYILEKFNENVAFC